MRWNELFDRFKGIQDRAKRSKGRPSRDNERGPIVGDILEIPREKVLPEIPKATRLLTTENTPTRPVGPTHKPKSSLSNLSSRLTRGVGQKGKK